MKTVYWIGKEGCDQERYMNITEEEAIKIYMKGWHHLTKLEQEDCKKSWRAYQCTKEIYAKDDADELNPWQDEPIETITIMWNGEKNL